MTAEVALAATLEAFHGSQFHPMAQCISRFTPLVPFDGFAAHGWYDRRARRLGGKIEDKANRSYRVRSRDRSSRVRIPTLRRLAVPLCNGVSPGC